MLQNYKKMLTFYFNTKSIYKIVQNILEYFLLNQGEKRSSIRSYRQVFSRLSK